MASYLSSTLLKPKVIDCTPPETIVPSCQSVQLAGLQTLLVHNGSLGLVVASIASLKTTTSLVMSVVASVLLTVRLSLL